jgi:hypothetical protein
MAHACDVTAEQIRDTLDAFLETHPELACADIQVAEEIEQELGPGWCFSLNIDGEEFEVKVTEAARA